MLYSSSLPLLSSPRLHTLQTFRLSPTQNCISTPLRPSHTTSSTAAATAKGGILAPLGSGLRLGLRLKADVVLLLGLLLGLGQNVGRIGEGGRRLPLEAGLDPPFLFQLRLGLLGPLLLPEALCHLFLVAGLRPPSPIRPTF